MTSPISASEALGAGGEMESRMGGNHHQRKQHLGGDPAPLPHEQQREPDGCKSNPDRKKTPTTFPRAARKAKFRSAVCSVPSVNTHAWHQQGNSWDQERGRNDEEAHDDDDQARRTPRRIHAIILISGEIQLDEHTRYFAAASAGLSRW
jgi:hypothetical protein